jgi:hypothetical protein
MKTHVHLYDALNIDQLEWPQTEVGQQAKSYLLPLIKEGVDKYIANVQTKLTVLAVDDLVIPITINEEEYQNSYVTSNYYIAYAFEEWLKKAKPPLRTMMKPFVWMTGKFLKWIKINKIVMVNNWFFSTNLYPYIRSDQIVRISEFLKKTFPDYVLIFRNINPLQCHHVCADLKNEKFRVIGIRQVYIYDPNKKAELSLKASSHHRKDQKLISKNGYEVVRCDELEEKDLTRLIELYQKVYIEKYTSFSPQYTEKFLKQAIQNGFMDFICVRKHGVIDGVMGVRMMNGMMSVPFFGYETSLPSSVGLYRMLSVLAIKEAEKRNLVLNDSSGSSRPKQYRGLNPFPEYTAVFDRHLSMRRRFFWALGEWMCNHIVFPLIKTSERVKREND